MEKILFLLILWMVLFSGGIFGAVYTEKRFEHFLPFSFGSIVALLLLAGIFDILLAGLYILVAVAVLLWVLAGWRIFSMLRRRDKCLRETLSRTISMGTIVFSALCIIFIYINYGCLCRGFDSYSHWAPTVKAMCYIDDFITNELARAWYPSYPPGTALVQYFFERLYMLMGGNFLEWILYYAYQLFFAAFMLPFIQRDEDETVLPGLLRVAVLFLIITYAPSYTAIEVDQIMGIILGGAIAMVLLSRERDVYCCAYVSCAAFVLVLLKAAGLLLGAFVALIFCLALIGDRSNTKKEKHAKAFIAVGSSILPFLLWLYERKHAGVSQSFSSKEAEFDLELIFRLLYGTEESYRQQALENCVSTLFGLRTEGAIFEVNVMFLTLLVFITLFLLGRYYYKTDGDRPVGRIYMSLAFLAEFAIFTIGTIFTIVLSFTEEEALNAASLERYMFTFILAVVIVFTLALLDLPRRCGRMKCAVAVFLLMCMVPYVYVADVGTRTRIQICREERSQFEQSLRNINDVCMEWSNVYVVAQGRYTPNWLQLRLGMYPCFIQDLYVWEELWSEPATEGIVTLSAQEWRKKLMDSYDYVSLFKIDEHFKEKYGTLFETGSPLEEDAVYAVDKNTGLLKKIS